MLARNQVATGEMLLQQRHRFAQYAASALFAELAHGALEVHRIGAKGQASAQRRGSSPAGQAAGQLGRHQGIPCHSTAAEPPPRARRHASPFDCGKPPLAADLRTTAFMSAEQSIARLDGLSDQRSAEAYELISMPTAISTARGAFQAMMLVLGVGRTMMSEIQRMSKKYQCTRFDACLGLPYLGCCCRSCRCPVSGVLGAPGPRHTAPASERSAQDGVNVGNPAKATP
jgi:hypothetical protein